MLNCRLLNAAKLFNSYCSKRFLASATTSQEHSTEPISETITTENVNFEDNLPPPWENPWIYALGKPEPPPKFTEVEECKEDFKWVQRLKPLPYIPDIPEHQSYPTPSGWRPPVDPPPNLPYYISRNRHHLFDIFMEKRRDTLDTNTVEFNYIEIVVLRNVHGDVFTCSEDLKTYLIDKVGHNVGVHVNEPQGKIRVKGADRSFVEQFLWDKGF